MFFFMICFKANILEMIKIPPMKYFKAFKYPFICFKTMVARNQHQNWLFFLISDQSTVCLFVPFKKVHKRCTKLDPMKCLLGNEKLLQKIWRRDFCQIQAMVIAFFSKPNSSPPTMEPSETFGCYRFNNKKINLNFYFMVRNG